MFLKIIEDSKELLFIWVISFNIYYIQNLKRRNFFKTMNTEAYIPLVVQVMITSS